MILNKNNSDFLFSSPELRARSATSRCDWVISKSGKQHNSEISFDSPTTSSGVFFSTKTKLSYIFQLCPNWQECCAQWVWLLKIPSCCSVLWCPLLSQAQLEGLGTGPWKCSEQSKESSAWAFPAPFSGWSGRALKGTHHTILGMISQSCMGLEVIQALNSAMKSEWGNWISMDFLGSQTVIVGLVQVLPFLFPNRKFKLHPGKLLH